MRQDKMQIPRTRGLHLLRCERNRPILCVKAYIWLEDAVKCNFDVSSQSDAAESAASAVITGIYRSLLISGH